MTLKVSVQRQLGEVNIAAKFASDGGVTALFGPSGAGKSSIINMLAGLLRPDAGRIEVDGQVLFDHASKVNVATHKRRIGYVFQDSRLFAHLSVAKNLNYGLRLTPVNERYIQPNAVIDLLGIGHLLKRYPASLSGGERQRVAMGRALLSSPKLLLMDEPLASLDAGRKKEIMPYIEKLRDEFRVPIVYVSHQITEVMRLADTLVILDHGQVKDSGPLTEVANRYELAALSGGHSQTGIILETQLETANDAFGLSTLSCQGGQLVVPAIDQAAGARVRVFIDSADVAIALKEPKKTSIQNQLAATVKQLYPAVGAKTPVALDLAGATLVAQITRKSAQQLALTPGQKVYVLIKSVALAL